MDDLEDTDHPLDFSNVLGDEDGNGGLGDLDGGGGDGQEAAGSGNGGVVDFVGGFDDAGGGGGGDDGGFGFGEGFGEGGDEEEAEGEDDDDSEEEEELELHVDEDGRLAFDGGEMDYAVRSFPNAFDLSAAAGPGVLRSVLDDCARVRSAKAQGQDGEYSEGDTYFLRADEAPTTRLEGVARSVFDFHTQYAAYDPARSGAEWWVQVLDEDDDIGLHFDKDYDLEDSGLNIHPHVATVTYLTDHGGPTMILPYPGPLQHGEDLTSSLRGVFLSLPERGKHTSFDGRFLHAAPAELRRLWAGRGQADDDDAAAAGAARNPDDEDDGGAGRKRVTLLVNVWLNHLPNSAERPGKKLLAQLAANDPPLRCTLPTARMSEQQRTALVMRGRGKARGASGGKGGKGVGAAEGAVVEVEVQSGACRTAKWIFRGEAKQRYAVSVPVPLDGSVPLASSSAAASSGSGSGSIQLIYEEEGLGAEIARDGKRKRGDEEEEEEEEESEEDGSEGEEDEGGLGELYEGDEGEEDDEEEEGFLED